MRNVIKISLNKPAFNNNNGREGLPRWGKDSDEIIFLPRGYAYGVNSSLYSALIFFETKLFVIIPALLAAGKGVFKACISSPACGTCMVK
jgi:hypothetical protein